ncbi:hypothetical protein E2C01_054667 [Portunus trituberculatus]|uniref:MADF domain-containing protein n=1 Tax=Portunus trituberculatus TaxID=210409 RepID=A0A5B7GVM3_PORTR|nr:hypothetical protein [Portunus trituberculatus]
MKMCHENVQTKYTNLRTSFKRELKKIRTVYSGSEGKSEPVDSQWSLFDSMEFLLDVVEPGPSCTTATFESHTPVTSIQACSPDESTLEEDDNLFPATGNSTFDTNQDVIRIKLGTATSSSEDTYSTSICCPSSAGNPITATTYSYTWFKADTFKKHKSG